MLMEQSLFVIEAPGKESTLRKILDRLGYNATVMSTKGRLYDLPTNTIGFDLENLNNIHLVALDQKLIDKLSQKISQANAVYIMTDDDPEGELIALHVKNLVKKDIVVERIRCNSMTFEGVKFALVSPSTVDFKIAQGSINRRVFDRISGYLLSGWKDLNSYRNGTVGRVISPFLNYINQNNKTPISISEFAVSSDDGPITISIKKPINSKISDSDISLLMRNCGVITATESSAIMRRIQTKPMNGPESLIFFSQRTGASINDVADSLQELYVNGLISYPRTETKGLSSFAQSTVRSIALSAGDTVDSHDNCKGDEIKTHDGLHVTGYNSCIEGNYSQMHLKDKIWTLLYRNNLSCFKDLILTEKKYNVANPSLMLIIDTLGIELSSFRKTVSEVGYKREYHYDDIAGLCPELSQGWSCPPSLDRFVAECLMEIGIGRPSTIPYHSLKISKQYLNATGALNYAGLSSINKALETAPLMLSIERIHEVDRLLLAGSEVSSTIYNSFHSVGITKELLFKQRTGGNRMRDNIFSEFSID